MDDREKQDRGIGLILGRREVFSLLGGAAGVGVFGSFLQASATLTSCVGKPEQTEGHEFTSQLYFDDSLTDHVYTLPPYSSRGCRMLRNDEDFIFRTGGKQLMLVLDKDGPGYTSTFDIGL